MTPQEATRAIESVCMKRRVFTFLDKLTPLIGGFEARIYTRLQDPRDLDRHLNEVGLDVRKITHQGGEWFLFTLVVKRAVK